MKKKNISCHVKSVQRGPRGYQTRWSSPHMMTDMAVNAN